MKEGKPDDLFAAWLALPDSQRNAMDTEFREIFEMSGEKGFRAMITFLDFNSSWKGAKQFHHADTLPYWRKRKHLPHKPAATDEASILQLADPIRTYSHLTEGRGKNCVVEPVRRCEQEYFFA